MRRLALLIAIVVGGLALWWVTKRPETSERQAVTARKPLALLSLPVTKESKTLLWKDTFGSIVLYEITRENSVANHFHRHTHEAWLDLSTDRLAFVPAYHGHGFDQAGRSLVFATEPDDGPIPVDTLEPDLLGRPTVETLSGRSTIRWFDEMIGKLGIISLESGAQSELGPFEGNAVLWNVRGEAVVAGETLVRDQGVIVDEGDHVIVRAGTPVGLLVFSPARTTVSPILRTETKRYSQNDEELVIRDFFHDRRSGVFVDVGAGHYQRDSNTFYLEERLGWSGIAVDALAELGADYRSHRPHTRFINFLVGDRSDGEQKFYRAEQFPEVSSTSKALAQKQAREFTGDETVTERTVPRSTLDALLSSAHIEKFDFLSMDIEEHEPAALAGFSIERFRPELVCIEAHEPVRDAIWRYFRRHNYVRLDQYLAWDSANWYFTPQR